MSRQPFESTRDLALELPETERAELASTLLASLDGPADSDAAQQWEAEIIRRLHQIDRGEAKFLKPHDVTERIRKRLAET